MKRDRFHSLSSCCVSNEISSKELIASSKTSQIDKFSPNIASTTNQQSKKLSKVLYENPNIFLDESYHKTTYETIQSSYVSKLLKDNYSANTTMILSNSDSINRPVDIKYKNEVKGQNELKIEIEKMLKENGYPEITYRKNQFDEFVVSLKDASTVITTIISDVEKQKKLIIKLRLNKKTAEQEIKTLTETIKIREKELNRDRRFLKRIISKSAFSSSLIKSSKYLSLRNN